jgi:hypothetical protein
MAEVTGKAIQGVTPTLGTSVVKLIYVSGTKVAQNDILTVTNLTTVLGCTLQFAAGTVETETFSTNVITLTSATTGALSGLVWGT